MVDHPSPAAADEPSDGGIAPRPRPGFTSARAPVSTASLAALFAGVVRVGVGLVGFCASLLLLPVHQATPILAGVSVLLVVTGNVSVWRAIDGNRALRLVFRIVVALSIAVLLGATAVVAVWGAGVLRTPPPTTPADDMPSVRFEGGP